MPPKAKITKQMILNTVLEITQESGFETANARSIANRLQCSTRPIFTCYENMEELKKDFLNFAFEYYSQYVDHYCKTAAVDAPLYLPTSYIAFAREQTYLFKLIFMSDMDLNMETTNDFYNEIGNEEKAKAFSNMVGVTFEKGKQIFLDLFLYAHGIAVLTATGKIALDNRTIEGMLSHFLSAFV